MRSVSFEVYYDSKYGENCYVVGDCAELGNWNALPGLKMNYNIGSIWTITLEVPDRTISYGFVKKFDYAADPQRSEWDPIQKRILREGESFKLNKWGESSRIEDLAVESSRKVLSEISKLRADFGTLQADVGELKTKFGDFVEIQCETNGTLKGKLENKRKEKKEKEKEKEKERENDEKEKEKEKEKERENDEEKEKEKEKAQRSLFSGDDNGTLAQDHSSAQKSGSNLPSMSKGSVQTYAPLSPPPTSPISPLQPPPSDFSTDPPTDPSTDSSTGFSTDSFTNPN